MINSNEQFIPPAPLNTAVLFLVFNRLDTVKQVFEAIKTAMPPRLYIASDGARKNRENELDKVEGVREYLLNNINWPCEVQTLFRDDNLGCKYAVSGAVSWFFEKEEQGIILEDDCLPSQSFFWYCEDLLERHKDSKDVYLISGDARPASNSSIRDSYAFIKYPLIWGWASWRSVWEKFDVNMEEWPNNYKTIIHNVSKDKNTKRYWSYVFRLVYEKKINSWAYPFNYFLISNDAKCIIPSQHLVSNIGFGEDATHTIDSDSQWGGMETYEITFPLSHPTKIDFDLKANNFCDKNIFSQSSLFLRAINKGKRLLNLSKYKFLKY